MTHSNQPFDEEALVQRVVEEFWPVLAAELPNIIESQQDTPVPLLSSMRALGSGMQQTLVERLKGRPRGDALMLAYLIGGMVMSRLMQEVEQLLNNPRRST